jgi:hypothetical protein
MARRGLEQTSLDAGACKSLSGNELLLLRALARDNTLCVATSEQKCSDDRRRVTSIFAMLQVHNPSEGMAEAC